MTMPNDEPLQTDEVITHLAAAGECAIVHIPSGKEAHILFDRSRNAYLVRYSCVSPMDEEIVRQAVALGFDLSTEVRGRHQISVSKVAQYCSNPRDAAIRALKLIRMLPEVGETDWLWQTVYDYDQREYPPPSPPDNWPPESERR